MQAGSKDIHIDLDAHELHPGDHVTGTVTFGPDEKARGARVELRCTNSFNAASQPYGPTGMLMSGMTGDAPNCEGVSDTLVVDEAELPSVQGEQRIELTVPDNAPPSAHDGKLPNQLEDLVSWQLRVSVDRRRAPDREALQAIRVRSRPGQYAGWAGRSTVASSPDCPVEVQLKRQALHPGESIEGTLVVSPREPVEARRVRVHLQQRRFDYPQSRQQGGRIEPTTNSSPWRSGTRKLSGPVQLDAGRDANSFDFELHLPKGIPPTFAAPHNDLHWYVVGVVDRKLRRDYTGEAEIVVYTGKKGAPERTGVMMEGLGGEYAAGTERGQPDSAERSELPSADPTEVVTRHRPRLGAPRIHVQEAIPRDLLGNAVAKYAKGVAADEVLVLVDTSIRQNGKAGLVVTPTRVFAHEPLQTTQVPLAEIAKVKLTHNYLEVNGTNLINRQIIDEGAEAVADLLRDLGEGARAG